MTPSFYCIVNLLCATYPIVWHVAFYVLVLRLRLALNYWPSSNNPDPDNLPVGLMVHGDLVQELAQQTFWAFWIWLFGIMPISLAANTKSRMLRRCVAVAGIVWLLGAVLIFSDPGRFIGNWFID